jgi:hypothetical protein
MLSFAISLLGIGKNLLSWLTAGVKWIFADIHRIAIAMLLGVCVWLYVGKQAETRRADKMTTVAAKWESAYVLVIEAQRLATIAAEKNKARVIAEYREINDEAEQDYERRIADSRAALQRWLRKNNTGSRAESDSPASTNLPKSPLPATENTEFLVTRKDLEIVAENHAQLLALIDWAEKIGQVSTEEVAIP